MKSPVRNYPGERYFFAAALFAAHRFFSAATILALPAALSFHLGFVTAWDTFGADSPFTAAYLCLCASAIFLRPAALIFRRGRVAGSVVAGSAGAPVSIARISAIWPSIRLSVVRMSSFLKINDLA
jgi:hypothetical protein